ncbi:MAG: GNAT family protein [Thermoplasmata archaeon]|nr:GNAT family protein [Thermoplasmata archaeon]
MENKPIQTPEIITERLNLRQLTEDDMNFILEFFTREETNRYVADDAIKSMEEARELFEAFIRPKPYLFRLGLFLKDTGQPIGTIGLYGVKMEDFRAVMGFDLLKEFWGNGYMIEAGQAILNYGFQELKLNRIQASADADNVRSLVTIERMGFKKEGVMRQKDFYKGAFHDDVVYSILKEEWMANRISST